MAWDFYKKRSRAVHILETVEHYLLRDGHITTETKKYSVDESWPVQPQGHQMIEQPPGCLRVPAHRGF